MDLNREIKIGKYTRGIGHSMILGQIGLPTSRSMYPTQWYNLKNGEYLMCFNPTPLRWREGLKYSVIPLLPYFQGIIPKNAPYWNKSNAPILIDTSIDFNI